MKKGQSLLVAIWILAPFIGMMVALYVLFYGQEVARLLGL